MGKAFYITYICEADKSWIFIYLLLNLKNLSCAACSSERGLRSTAFIQIQIAQSTSSAHGFVSYLEPYTHSEPDPHEGFTALVRTRVTIRNRTEVYCIRTSEYHELVPHVRSWHQHARTTSLYCTCGLGISMHVPRARTARVVFISMHVPRALTTREVLASACTYHEPVQHVRSLHQPARTTSPYRT
jgi:hypothetical protein